MTNKENFNMNKKPVQIIVMIFIGIMFIATVVITIVLKPSSNSIYSTTFAKTTSFITTNIHT